MEFDRHQGAVDEGPARRRRARQGTARRSTRRAAATIGLATALLLAPVAPRWHSVGSQVLAQSNPVTPPPDFTTDPFGTAKRWLGRAEGDYRELMRELRRGDAPREAAADVPTPRTVRNGVPRPPGSEHPSGVAPAARDEVPPGDAGRTGSGFDPAGWYGRSREEFRAQMRRLSEAGEPAREPAGAGRAHGTVAGARQTVPVSPNPERQPLSQARKGDKLITVQPTGPSAPAATTKGPAVEDPALPRSTGSPTEAIVDWLARSNEFYQAAMRRLADPKEPPIGLSWDPVKEAAERRRKVASEPFDTRRDGGTATERRDGATGAGAEARRTAEAGKAPAAARDATASRQSAETAAREAVRRDELARKAEEARLLAETKRRQLEGDRDAIFRRAEAVRKAEETRQAELQRTAAEAEQRRREAAERRLAEARRSEEERQAAARRAEADVAERRRLEQEAKSAEDRRRAEVERLAADARRREQDDEAAAKAALARRIADAEKAAAARRAAEAQRIAEARRIALEKDRAAILARAEAARKAEQERLQRADAEAARARAVEMGEAASRAADEVLRQAAKKPVPPGNGAPVAKPDAGIARDGIRTAKVSNVDRHRDRRSKPRRRGRRVATKVDREGKMPPAAHLRSALGAGKRSASGRAESPRDGKSARRGRSERQLACRRAAGKRVALPGVYVVARGDSLWRIAESHYEHGKHYHRIREANAAKIADEDLIFPCQRFALPDRKSRRKR